MSISTMQMLDNAATASQDRGLLVPATRGAVLRSMVQWIESQDDYEDRHQGGLVDQLKRDPEYDR